MPEFDPELAAALLILCGVPCVVLFGLLCLGAFVEWFHDRRKNLSKSFPRHARKVRQ